MNKYITDLLIKLEEVMLYESLRDSTSHTSENYINNHFQRNLTQQIKTTKKKVGQRLEYTAQQRHTSGK